MVCWGMCLCFVHNESKGKDYHIVPLLMRLKADYLSGLAGSSERVSSHS